MVKRKTRKKKKKNSSSNYLDLISEEIIEKPWLMFLYGPPGVGKTSVVANMEKPVFMIDNQELGIHDLKQARQLPKDIPVLPVIDSYEMALEVLHELSVKKNLPYKTLGIDAIGGFERLCQNHVIEEEFGGDGGKKGFLSFMQGYDIIKRQYWPEFLNAISAVRDNGLNIAFIGHSTIVRHDDPENEAYDRFAPDVHKKTWGVTSKWAEVILFCNYFVEIEKEGLKAKGRGGQDRYFYTQWHAAYEAKNRWGLTEEISMGESGREAYKNLMKAVNIAKGVKSKKKKKKRRTT